MLNQVNHEIFRWTPALTGNDWHEITPLRTEASTRKFWRCKSAAGSFVLMYSPPATEHNDRFIQLGATFHRSGIPVPSIYEFDLKRGFFLLEDVGMKDFHSQYVHGNVDHCFALAFQNLSNIQTIDDSSIPPYEATRLHEELQIFQEFLCDNLIGLSTKEVQAFLNYLVTEISALPKVTIHRDYHCKNLLVRDQPPYLGVVDFQDALVGPITYDLASLLYDCYWDHDYVTIEKQILGFWKHGLAACYKTSWTHEAFAKALKLTAVQRLLKAAGIFVRLWLQREQATHLAYVLPTLRKARAICIEIEELHPLGQWLEQAVIPETLLHLPPPR